MMPWEKYGGTSKETKTSPSTIQGKPWEQFNQPAVKHTAKPTTEETPGLLQNLVLTPSTVNRRVINGKYMVYNEDVKATINNQYKAQSKRVVQAMRKASNVATDTEALYSKFHTSVKSIKSMFNDTIDSVDTEDIATLQTSGWSNIQNDGGYVTGVKDGEAMEIKLSDIVQAERDKTAQAVVNELAAQGFQGVQSTDGKLSVNIEGMQLDVDGDMLRDMWAHKWELLAGTAAGATAVVAAPATAAALTMGAAATGVASAGGAYIDSIANRIDMVNDVDEKVIKDKMIDAGIYGAVTNVIGDLAYLGVKYPAKYVKHIYDGVMDGNVDGAYRHALNHFGVTDAQAKEVVSKMEELVGPMRGTDKEKAIEALTLSRPGGEAVANVANVFNPGASSNMANQVIKRADDLLKASKELSAENAPTMIRRELNAYVDEVSNFYGTVKQAGADVVPDYSFNFDDTAIRPILTQIGKNIEDPAIKQRYADILARIDDATTDRSFNALIDLREQVNKMKYASKSITNEQKQSLDLALKGIDTEIDKVSKELMPGGNVWKENWDKAKVEYSKMKDVQENVLYKALTEEGVSPDEVINALDKYIRADDNTFLNVMDKLPKNIRSRAEGLVLDKMVEKYAIGNVGGNRAIHFPALSQELSKLKFLDPKTKQLARTIDRMADVFKNDVNLARVAGRIEVPHFQSYLTTDPVIRLKYEIASNIFNYVKQLRPGDQSDALALVKNAGRILEDPISAKSVKELNSLLPKDNRLFRDRLKFDETLNELRQLYVQRQQAMKQFKGGDNVPPRLVWKTPREAPLNIVETVDQVLYATAKGTVGRTPTDAIMKDRTDDLIQEFIWQSTKDLKPDEVVAKTSQYITADGKAIKDILENVRNRLVAGDRQKNAHIVGNIIKYEANKLRRAIEKDFGVRMSDEEAKKLIQYRFQETFKDCK